MPIYEYYSPDTNRIYSFYAKTLAQGRIVPRCPDNPGARMVKLVSGFAVGGRRRTDDGGRNTEDRELRTEDGGDAQMDAAMEAMEREFSGVDENDPRAMGRMMRRMAELSGEKLDAPMEEAVRKLEEGADPDTLEDRLGDAFGPEDGGDGYGAGPMPPGADKPEPKEPRARLRPARPTPVRDPKLYDYE